jgi:DNA-binding MarR family transcriptional regulator
MQVTRVNRPPATRTVAERLHAAAIHLLRRLRRQDDRMGLTPARASALSIMVFGGTVTIGQLAQAEHVSAPTMTRLIVGMERDGLVRRDADPHDGRVVWLHATAKGGRILHEGRARRVEALAAELATLGTADRATLAAAADILERVLSRPATGSKTTRARSRDDTGSDGTRTPRARRRSVHGSAGARRTGTGR